MTAPHPTLTLTDEVRDALATGAPVVALESTIISHGMPYPDNVGMAREVEQLVRDGGAVPATIALLDGAPRIGLTDDELELLGSAPGVTKVSVRDLGQVAAARTHGATTCSATMRLAALAGIRVFVTGGLGGVHQGGAQSMDISADLIELGRTPVAIISAGVKSILDIGLTLEVLETHGVPVVGYGTDDFPAFYSRSSGYAVPMRLDTPEQVAAMMHAHWGLGIPTGISIANPVPEQDELPREEVDRIIAQVLAEAHERGIAGQDVTPFLLGRIVDISDGRSLRTNIALVRHNARLGAAVAAAWAAAAHS